MKIDKWSPTQAMHITDEGKHVLPFSKDFPFELRFYHFQHNHRLTPTVHEYLEITVVFEGSGSFYVEDTRYEVSSGDVIVMGNTGFHRLEAGPTSPTKVICIFFLPELIYRPGGPEIDFAYLSPFLQYGPGFRHVIPAQELPEDEPMRHVERMHRELTEKRDYFRLAVKNVLLELIILISRYYGAHAMNLSGYQRRLNKIARLRKAFTYLDRNYQERVSLDDVAREVFMSPSHFCKVFKKTTGCTLVEYVLRLRVDKAKEMLLVGDKSITQIAHEVGFDSHSYFDKIFHRMTKVSPQQYRLSQDAR